ncbi:MAG: hypothetical protein HYZ01_04315 [Ignavibacteriales bacterium]|nr:hypothetical protein [Ignavibacteriales bacterium]
MSCQIFETSKRESLTAIFLPSDFQLTMGEGGGFTGRWNGLIVDSTGTVFSWYGITPGQNAERITKLTRPEFEKLWQTIVNAQFFDIDTTGTDNITLAMQVTAAGKVHRASWAKPAETRSRLAPVHVLYDSCRTIVSREK